MKNSFKGLQMRCIDEVIYGMVFWVATMCTTEHLALQKGLNTTVWRSKGWSIWASSQSRGAGHHGHHLRKCDRYFSIMTGTKA